MRNMIARGRVEKGEWVYGLPIESKLFFDDNVNTICIVTKSGLQWVDGLYMTYEDCITVEANSVGWFTGLTDKNGTKIFEGDIIKWHDNTELSISGQIAEICYGKYIDADSHFDDVYLLGFYFKLFDKDKTCATISWLDEYKNDFDIIGNIYDNPELLAEVN